MEEINMILEMADESMNKAIKYTQSELQKIRAGRANPNMLDGIMVMYYGAPVPLNQVASVTTPDARTISIKPFEKGVIKDIEKAIINSNLGLNPANDGEIIRLNLPPLTEERRRDLVKKVKAETEVAKINIRKVRQDANEELKNLKNDGVSEDAIKIGEDRVQELTNKFSEKIDELLKNKEIDIMSV